MSWASAWFVLATYYSLLCAQAMATAVTKAGVTSETESTGEARMKMTRMVTASGRGSWIPSMSTNRSSISTNNVSSGSTTNNNDAQGSSSKTYDHPWFLLPDYYDTLRTLPPITDNNNNATTTTTMLFSSGGGGGGPTVMATTDTRHDVAADIQDDVEEDDKINSYYNDFDAAIYPKSRVIQVQLNVSSTSTTTGEDGGALDNEINATAANNTTVEAGSSRTVFQLCELTTLLPYTYSISDALNMLPPPASSSSSSTSAFATADHDHHIESDGGGGGGHSVNNSRTTNKTAAVPPVMNRIIARPRVHEDSAAVLMAIYLFNNAVYNDELGRSLSSIIQLRKKIPPADAKNATTAAMGQNSNATYVGARNSLDEDDDEGGSSSDVVRQILSTCTMKFTTTLLDTHLSPIRSTSMLTSIFNTPHTFSHPQPCGIIGPYSSSVTSPTAIFTSVKETPQVSYAASSGDFDNKEQYPTFGRTCTNTVADARALLSYLHSLSVSRAGMIFVTNSFGSSMAKAVLDNASDFGIVINPVSISYDSYRPSSPGGRLEIVNALRHLKQSDYRYFVAVLEEMHYEVVMCEAYRQGIVGSTSMSADRFRDGGCYDAPEQQQPPPRSDKGGGGGTAATAIAAGIPEDDPEDDIAPPDYDDDSPNHTGVDTRGNDDDDRPHVSEDTNGEQGGDGDEDDEDDDDGHGGGTSNDEGRGNDPNGQYVWLLDGVDIEMIKKMVNGYQLGSPLAEASQGVGILQLTGPRRTTTSTTTATMSAATKDTTTTTSNGTHNNTNTHTVTAATTVDSLSSTYSVSTNYHNFRTEYGRAIADPTFQSYVRSKQPNSIHNATIHFQNTPTEWGHFLFDTVMALGLAACQATTTNRRRIMEGLGTAAGTAPFRQQPKRRRRRRQQQQEYPTFITGDDIYGALMGVDYNGASGHVQLDPDTGTRLASSVTYEMINIVPVVATTGSVKDEASSNSGSGGSQGPGASKGDGGGGNQFAFISSAVFIPSSTGGGEGTTESHGNWTTLRPFRYYNGGTAVPMGLPPPFMNENYIGTPSRVSGYVLLSIVTSLAIIFAIWTIWKRNAHVVKASHPTFLMMLCVGCVIMASAIVPSGLEETVASHAGLTVACMAFPWFYVIGFSIVFSGLFAKTWQLYKVFRNPDLDSIAVRPQHLLQSLLFFVVMNAALLTAWTLTSALVWRRIDKSPTDRFHRPIDSYGTCMCMDNKERLTLTFVVAIVAFNLSALLFANVRAYQARSIHTEYRESHYLSIIMASILQAWCLGIPIMIVVLETPQAKFWVETGIIFVTSTATLLLAFVPKWMAYRNELVQRKRERKRASLRIRERRSIGDFDTDMDSGGFNGNGSGSVVSESKLSLPNGVVVSACFDVEKEKAAVAWAAADDDAPSPVDDDDDDDDADNDGKDEKKPQDRKSSSVTFSTDNSPSTSAEELKIKLAAAQERNMKLEKENERIEKELMDIKSNTSSQ